MIPSYRWLLTLLLPLAACTSAGRKDAEYAQMQKEAAREVRRICDLPPAEREAELEAVRRESGIEVFCGKE